MDNSREKLTLLRIWPIPEEFDLDVAFIYNKTPKKISDGQLNGLLSSSLDTNRTNATNVLNAAIAPPTFCPRTVGIGRGIA